MGTCRGWPREGWATMATQLLQLLGRAVNSSCPESAALAGRRGELWPIRHRPAFARAPVGFRQLLVYHLLAIIVHSGRGQLTFDPLLLFPSRSLLGQTVGKWLGDEGGALHPKLPSVNTDQMPAHSRAGSWIHTAFYSGLHGGEGEGERRDWEDIVIQTKRAAEWSHRGQKVCIGLRLSPLPSSIRNCLASCKCLFIFEAEKKGLSNTKGKKIDRMEGIKGVKLRWWLESCKLGLGAGECRGCWMGGNNCNGECFCYVGNDPINKDSRCYLHTWDP